MKLTISVVPQLMKYTPEQIISIFNDNKLEYVMLLQQEIYKRIVNAYIFQSAYGFIINLDIHSQMKKKIISCIDEIIQLTQKQMEKYYTDEEFIVVLNKLNSKMCVTVAVGPSAIGWSTTDPSNGQTPLELSRE